jgi:hypothetical protein
VLAVGLERITEPTRLVRRKPCYTAPMPSRVVHQGDGIGWLQQAELPADHALVTSLPDSSELRLSFDAWRHWFTDAAALACRVAAPASVAVFFQTDVKREGTWVDKSFLVQLGARAAGVELLFHKVVCRAPPGVTIRDRPGYAHLLCFSRELRLDPKRASADVLAGLGEMPWPRAMGVRACEAVASFLLEHTECRTVVDPFCGIGTMLAVANARGLDAIGVELSAKRAERARTLTLRG